MRRRAGNVAQAYESGRADRLVKIAEALTIIGVATARDQTFVVQSQLDRPDPDRRTDQAGPGSAAGPTP